MASGNICELEEDVFLSQVQTVRKEISDKFSRARKLLEERETALLAELQGLEDEYTGEGMSEKIKQMNITKDNLIATLKENENKEMLDQSMAPINARINELEAKLQNAKDTYKTMLFEWDDELEVKLSATGSILLNAEKKGVPEYKSLSEPVLVFGKHSESRSLPGVFGHPEGIAIDPVSNHVYICDMGFNRVQVFTSQFEFLFLFNEKMEAPAGICIKGNKVYITQFHGSRLNAYSTLGKFLRENSGSEFNSPRGIDVSLERKSVYVADSQNNRVQCLNLDLSFDSFINEIGRPLDVRLLSEEIAVLCRQSPCLVFYNYSHQVVREMIAIGENNQVEFPIFAYIDNASNILISDFKAHCLFVFSHRGELLRKIGKEGEKRGEFLNPTGVTVNPEGRILVASRNSNNCIQMF